MNSTLSEIEEIEIDDTTDPQRAHRLGARIQQLEHRLSQVLGEQVCRESGLGQPADIEHLQHQTAWCAELSASKRAELVPSGQVTVLR